MLLLILPFLLLILLRAFPVFGLYHYRVKESPWLTAETQFQPQARQVSLQIFWFTSVIITLPVLLSDIEFMYLQCYMISALDSIIKLFFTSSSSSSSLLINHISDCTFKKIVLPSVLFLILHFTIVHTLLATHFHPFCLHGPSVLPYVMISSPLL